MQKMNKISSNKKKISINKKKKEENGRAWKKNMEKIELFAIENHKPHNKLMCKTSVDVEIVISIERNSKQFTMTSM